MKGNKEGGTGTAKRRVFIVDDHELIRFGVSQFIAQQPDLEVCGEAEDTPSALAQIGAKRPDLVIVDLSLKSSGGLDLIRSVRKLIPGLPILVLSMHQESIYGESALRAGAKGYLMKEDGMTQLLEAIRRVLSGRIYASEQLVSALLRERLHAPDQTAASRERLSARELEVLRLLGQWKSTARIATELRLSVKTVEYYREQLKRKLNLRSGSELVRYAVEIEAQDGGDSPRRE